MFRNTFLLILFLLLSYVEVLGDDLNKADSIFQNLCSRCHGSDGRGVEDFAKLGLDVPPANFTDPAFNSREPKYVWKRVIRDGGARHGYSSFMPSFGGVLSEKKIDELVGYIKNLGYDPKYPQGELNFTRSFFTSKAFPEDEIIYIGNFGRSSDKASYKQTFYFAKRLGPVFQLEIKNTFVHSNDFSGEIEGGVKWNIVHLEESLIISSLGLELSLPYSSDEKFSYIPYIAFGKGFGPKVSLQASSKLKHSPSSGDMEIILSSVLHYVPTIEVGRVVIPAIEFLADYKDKKVIPFVVPQLYFSLTRRGHVALNLGFKQPLRKNDEKFSVVGFLLWEFVDGWFFEGW